MKSNVKGFTNRAVINKEAAQWILFLEETPELSQSQIKALNEWVATSDVHRKCLINMVASWGEMDLLAGVMLPKEMQKTPFLKATLTTLLAGFSKLKTTSVSCWKRLSRPIMIVPLLLFAMLGLVIVMMQLKPAPRTIELTTRIGETRIHKMPDGSTMWLNSSSHVKFNYNQQYRRINLLRGEAHFEVAKDASRPFEVYANDRLIKAIGTAFSVHKLRQSIEVLVTEGTVELAIVDGALVMVPDDLQQITTKEAEIVTKSTPPFHPIRPTNVKKVLHKLTAGQRASIPIERDDLTNIEQLDSSEVTRSLSWKEGKLVFAGESLEEVIQEITRHTKVKIEVVDPKLKSIRIGGQFQVGETDSLFYVLESGFGIGVNKLDENHVKLYIK